VTHSSRSPHHGRSLGSFLEYLQTQYIDWTWRRANHLRQANKVPQPRVEGRWVTETWRYLSSVESSTGADRRGISALRRRVFAQTIDLHEARGLERDILEARLLSGQSHEEISDRSSFPRDAVEAYEHIFFSFRQFQSSRYWMTNHAVKMPSRASSTPVGTVLRKYGYLSGPVALEMLIDVVSRTDGRSLCDDLPDISTSAGLAELSIRRLLALELLPSDARSAKAFSELHTDALESDRFPEIPEFGTLSLTDLLKVLPEVS
jgi:hypothetical protein